MQQDRQHLKEQRRAAKAQQQAQVTASRLDLDQGVDCACVIHSTGYNWVYVERLQRMLTKHISANVRFHVFTEHNREVPTDMIKHVLQEWPGIAGPKKSWWYKIQLFNTVHHQGPMLYLDLDTVVVNNLDWIFKLDPSVFWTIRDFKRLWKPNSYAMNSSVMWWDTRQFGWVWDRFNEQNITKIMQKYRGDQDFLLDTIDTRRKRFFEEDRILSWRWQALDGGFNFNKRIYNCPGTGTQIGPRNSLLVFHGNPKPHDVNDGVILEHWAKI